MHAPSRGSTSPALAGPRELAGQAAGLGGEDVACSALDACLACHLLCELPCLGLDAAALLPRRLPPALLVTADLALAFVGLEAHALQIVRSPFGLGEAFGLFLALLLAA